MEASNDIRQSSRADSETGRGRPACSTLKIYVCAVGAAFAATVFDGVHNDRAAALRKTAEWLSGLVANGVPEGALPFALATLFFCAFAALMVLAYHPRETKEAFLLGLGVLGTLNVAVKPPVGTAQAAAQAPAQAQAQAFSLVPQAYAASAQPADSTAQEPVLLDAWFFVRGSAYVRSRDITLTVYSAGTRKRFLLTAIRPIDSVRLPPGRYHFELSQPGYRSIVFTGELRDGSIAFTGLTLQPSSIDGLANLLGPQRVSVNTDRELGVALKQARAQCDLRNKAGAREALKDLRPYERGMLASDEVSRSLLCAGLG